MSPARPGGRIHSLVGSAAPFVLVAGLVASAPVQASGEAPRDDDQQAMSVLQRAVEASRTLAYRGTQMVSAWTPDGTSTRVLQVRQLTGGSRWVTAREAGQVDAVTTLHPGPAVEGSGLDPESVLALALLAQSYQLAVQGTVQVAGRTATVVVASRAGREAARIWLDRQYGLPLRQEVFDDAGRLRRIASFLDIEFTVPKPGPTTGRVASGGTNAADRDTAVPPGVQVLTPTWSHLLSAADMRRLQAQGWVCPASLPGGFRLVDARRGPGTGAAAAVHLTYTDGLSGISVFVQRGRLDVAGLTGFHTRRWDGRTVLLADGWPTRLVWQGGSSVITVVSDASSDELRAIVDALPYQRSLPAAGLMARLGRGLRASLAWVRGR